jgi:methionyl-tRNA formyltransferase
MNIVFLTADEPIYLPRFFTRLLSRCAADTRAVFVVPSRYGKDSAFRMAKRYVAAFGVFNLVRLLWRTAKAKLFCLLKVGRSRGVYHSVPAAAQAHGIHCELVQKVNAKDFLQRLRDMKTDVIVSVSCPQIFKKALIEVPPRGCLNMHGALLPKYRGIAPSFWMMAHGETRAGVTVFFVNEDIDAGDVIEVEAFDIHPDETLDTFIVRSKEIACEALLRAIRKVADGNVSTTPLDKEKGSYFGFPTREGYREFRRRGRRLW